MVLGRELIADVEDIENDLLLETIDAIETLMEKIIEICKLKVVAKCEYQFTLLLTMPSLVAPFSGFPL